MKFSAIIAGVAAHNVTAEVETAYLSYIAEHGKSYGTEEEFKFRLATFARNQKYIEQYNAKVTDDASTVGLNHMADWTHSEYKKLLGYRTRIGRKAGIPMMGVHEAGDQPASIDWRAKGAVTPVKNQGQCGSCWSFSTTGSLEGRYQIAGNKLTSFSEQQLVDCSKAEGNQGCNGGLMDDAFTYLEKNKIETEADYGYTARDGTCKYDATKGVTGDKSFHDVTPKDPVALKTALQGGPVSVAIDAGGLNFQLYFGGIMKHFCGTSLDHGVLVVGYGTEGSTDYWILKNSWGAGWGEKGYFRILRTMDAQGPGVCGLQLDASYPIV